MTANQDVEKLDSDKEEARIEAEKAKNIKYAWIGTALLAILFSIVSSGYYALLMGDSPRPVLSVGPNEIGDTLAGFAGAIAFIWLIAGFNLQRLSLELQHMELKKQRQEFEEHRKEFAKQSEEFRSMVFLDALSHIQLVVDNNSDRLERCELLYSELLKMKPRLLNLFKFRAPLLNKKDEDHLVIYDEWYELLSKLSDLRVESAGLFNVYEAIRKIYIHASSRGEEALLSSDEIRSMLLALKDPRLTAHELTMLEQETNNKIKENTRDLAYLAPLTEYGTKLGKFLVFFAQDLVDLQILVPTIDTRRDMLGAQLSLLSSSLLAGSIDFPGRLHNFVEVEEAINKMRMNDRRNKLAAMREKVERCDSESLTLDDL